jgi:hypothetical protein
VTYHLAKERRRDEKRNKTRAPEVAERRRQRHAYARGAEASDLMLDAAIDRAYAAQTLTGVTKILCSFIQLSPTL